MGQLHHRARITLLGLLIITLTWTLLPQVVPLSHSLGIAGRQPRVLAQSDSPLAPPVLDIAPVMPESPLAPPEPEPPVEPLPTDEPTPTATPTETPAPTFTPTPLPPATWTPEPTATATVPPTDMATATATATLTSTSTATVTPSATPSATTTVTPTVMPTVTATWTATPAPTATREPQPSLPSLLPTLTPAPDLAGDEITATGSVQTETGTLTAQVLAAPSFALNLTGQTLAAEGSMVIQINDTRLFKTGGELHLGLPPIVESVADHDLAHATLVLTYVQIDCGGIACGVDSAPSLGQRVPQSPHAQTTLPLLTLPDHTPWETMHLTVRLQLWLPPHTYRGHYTIAPQVTWQPAPGG